MSLLKLLLFVTLSKLATLLLTIARPFAKNFKYLLFIISIYSFSNGSSNLLELLDKLSGLF